jgi:hypothetical protein
VVASPAPPGSDLDRVLMVDDESHKLEKNHALRHSSFILSDARPNLRTIEKRRWRSDPGGAAS